MNMNPLVSIVVPAYNYADYLKECIESVLSQTWDAIELIVLDDGSTDATRDVLNTYGKRFQWESHANIGQSATLTKGWAMASGEILGYLSADDVLHPEAVAEAVAALMTKPKIVAAYCDFELIDKDSLSVRLVKARDFDARDLVFKFICQPGPGAFFRRDAYLLAGPWDSKLRQNPDLDFWLRLSLLGDFLRIPKVLAGFRVHEGSATYQSTDLGRADEPVLIAARFTSLPDLPEWICKKIRHVLAAGYLSSAQLHLRAGRFRFAVSRVFSALRISGASVFSKHCMHMLLSALTGRLFHHARVIWAKVNFD
jgi:glycosyltransferase involved in cell wall biosynthesis